MRQLWIVLFVILVFTVGAAGQEVSPQTIVRVSRAVGQIQCVDPTGQTVRLLGTGFFVSASGTIVTDRHVVENYLSDSSCILRIVVAVTGTPGATSPSPIACWSSTSDDIELCCPKVQLAGMTGFLTLQPNEFAQGTDVAFAGYPENAQSIFTTKGSVSGYTTLTGFAGSVYILNARRLVLDTFSWPGESGSPVFADDGKVVGVLEGTTSFMAPSTAPVTVRVVYPAPSPSPSPSPTIVPYGNTFAIPAADVIQFLSNAKGQFDCQYNQ